LNTPQEARLDLTHQRDRTPPGIAFKDPVIGERVEQMKFGNTPILELTQPSLAGFEMPERRQKTADQGAGVKTANLSARFARGA
jgi:hypothetical protein